ADLNQETGKVVDAPLAGNLAIGKLEQRHERHAKGFAGRRQTEKAAGVCSTDGESLCDAIAVNQRWLVGGECGSGKGGEPLAIDVLYRASAVDGAASGRTLEHAVHAMERSEHLSIPAPDRLLAACKDVLHILARHRNPFRARAYPVSRCRREE